MLVAELGPLIPHAGTMRLLHDVVSWDTESIECRAISHRDPANPLRLDGRLPAIAGLEYGAQAMAIHGALVATGAVSGAVTGAAAGAAAPPAIGLLVAAHEVVCSVERLDDVATDLTVRATRVIGSARQVVYEFTVAAPDRTLVSGRASVMLSVDPPRGST